MPAPKNAAAWKEASPKLERFMWHFTISSCLPMATRFHCVSLWLQEGRLMKRKKRTAVAFAIDFELVAARPARRAAGTS